jgi:hypothetical protein
MEGEPTAACLAKELFAQHVRYGDWVSFPGRSPEHPDIDAVLARADAREDGGGRLSGVFVNTGSRLQTLTASDWDPQLAGCREVLRLDSGTGDRVVREPFEGTVRLEGYGVAVVSTAPSAAIAASGLERRR